MGCDRVAMNALKKLRASIRPDIRQAIDGVGVVFGITLFFCLLNSAYDGIVNRNRSDVWHGLVQAARHPADGNLALHPRQAVSALKSSDTRSAGMEEARDWPPTATERHRLP